MTCRAQNVDWISGRFHGKVKALVRQEVSMVMARHQWCGTCEAETLHHNNKCTKCMEREKRVERAKWNALTNEEKIEVLLKRVEQLEKSPIKY